MNGTAMHTHIYTRSGMWPQKKRHMRPNKIRLIMVQKESHNHVQTHTRTKQSHWDVAPGEETYKRMHPNDIRNIYFCMKKGTAMHTHTQSLWDVTPVKERNMGYETRECTRFISDEWWRKKKGTTIQTHKHAHWDVTQGEETHKRVHPNDIR